MIKYSWRPAQADDIAKIVAMAEQHFQSEIDAIFTPQPIVYSRHITFAVVNQYYNPQLELLQVAVDRNKNSDRLYMGKKQRICRLE